MTAVDMTFADSASERLVECAAQVRKSGALGRSGMLAQLFDVLVARGLRADGPACEADLFIELFGRNSRHDPGDSSIRVAVHRLRRKLDAYNAQADAGAAHRLTIPKGEYRLAVSEKRDDAVAQTGGRAWFTLLLVAALFASLTSLVALYVSTRSPWDATRRDALWAPLLSNGRPIRVLVSDYYVFGDTQGGPETRRLVRDFDINSARELGAYLATHGDEAERYIDLDLSYVPASGAVALQRVLPVLSQSHDVETSLMSGLSADMLKGENIVYVGFLSGLGMLRDPLFAGSRFRIGENYDELVDRVTGRRFVSEAGGPVAPDASNTDYAYLASFQGPAGSRVVVIAGARDIGVMQMADLASRADALRALHRRVGDARDFEALYAVDGVGRSNLGGRLLEAFPLKADLMWAGGASPGRLPQR